MALPLRRPQMAPARIYGTLPDYIGTWDVFYSVTTVGTDGDTDGDTVRVTFQIAVADTPEAVTELKVVAAGPSSLEVTWKAPEDNNAPIISYDLEYKAGGTPETDWLPALLPVSIVASKSYTIEGLAPGPYDVRVRATNTLGDSIWAETGGSTGAGPGKPTLTVTVDSPMPEDRDGIPVTVKATVPPSALSRENPHRQAEPRGCWDRGRTRRAPEHRRNPPLTWIGLARQLSRSLSARTWIWKVKGWYI